MRYIWIFLIFGCLAHSYGVADIRIELKPRFQAQSSRVFLGDVAALSSSNLLTVQRFSSLQVGIAPLPDRVFEISREQLDSWVRARSVRGSEKIYWSGADSVVIESVAQEISASKLALLARSEMISWLNNRYTHYEVDEGSVASHILAPAGVALFSVRKIPAQTYPMQVMQVWIDVQVGDSWQRSIPVSFKVSVFQNMLVTSESMRAKQVISAQDVELKSIDITKIKYASDEASTSIKQGYRLKNSVRKGAVVLRSQLEPVPVIFKGSTAVIRIKTGVVELENTVEALQDGQEGQRIRVKKIGTNQSMWAKVVSQNLVVAAE